MDYMYMRSKHEDREEGNMRRMPILVIVDRRSRYVAAHVVKEKGNDGSAIKVLRQELDSMGYRRIACRNDQESPVEALKSAVKREWSGEMVPEKFPSGGTSKQRNDRESGTIRSMYDTNYAGRVGKQIQDEDRWTQPDKPLDGDTRCCYDIEIPSGR